MAAQQLSAFMSAAGSCAHEMLANACYIEKELPSAGVPESYRNAILEVCSALIGTKHDVISELHELVELGAPAASTVVQERVERIHRWLGEEMPKFHPLLTSVEPGPDAEPWRGLAYVLVAESATNVLRCFSQVSEAAVAYREAVRLSENA